MFECCPACNSIDFSVVRRLDSVASKKFSNFSAIKYGGLLENLLPADDIYIVACKKCGHHWYGNQPSYSELLRMYNIGSKLHNIYNENLPDRNIVKEMNRLYSLVNTPHPTILDYGSGFGKWALAAQNVGFEVFAYEPSSIRSKNQSNSFYLTNDLANLKNIKFDAINVEQVLEHVSDPRLTLLSIRDFCKKDTVIRITVPNILRAHEGRNIWDEWPWNGSRMHTMAPYEHLHGFTPKSLERILITSGFKILGDGRVFLNYPILVGRRWFGKLIPTLGSTKVIAKIIL